MRWSDNVETLAFYIGTDSESSIVVKLYHVLGSLDIRNRSLLRNLS